VRAPEALAELVRMAAEQGIVVEALDGDPSWALASGQESFWPKLDAILAWNDQQPADAKIVGIHLDIEPYLLKQFKTDEKPRVMREYLEMLGEVSRRLKARNPPLTLAADIPFWYDSRQENESDNCFFEFGGKKQPLNRHVQDICDYVAVMSYRQKAVGGNSISSISEGEMAYAEQIGKKVFPSVEMTEVGETPSISFYGTSPSLFGEQYAILVEALKAKKSFGGVMIHHYKSYNTYLSSGKPGGAS